MPIDIRSLRYFVGIASAGSISKAAETLHVAQPALSVHIKEMEGELGTLLFDRTPKGVVPTAAGLALLRHAHEILRRLEIVYDDIRDSVSQPSGRVAIGLPQSMAKILTVPLIQTVLARWPKIRLQVIDLNSGYIAQHLLSSDIDIGMTFLGTSHPGLRFTRLVEEELIVVGAPGRFATALGPRQTRRATVRAATLARYPLILPAAAHSLRMLIESFQAINGVTLNVIAEVNAIPQLIDLAAADVGCTILSYAAVKDDLEIGRISAARIADPRMTREVFISRSATAPLSVATLAVNDLIATMVKTMVAEGRWPTTVS